MKDKIRKERPVAMHMKCEDIQSLLLDYINGELGEGRRDLVRDHLEKCKKCQDAVQDMKVTIAILKKSSARNEPHLSMNRHQRILRALLHPFQEWMISHHILISLLMALVIIIFVWLAMCRIKVISGDDPLEGTVPVYWHSNATNMENRPWIERQ